MSFHTCDLLAQRVIEHRDLAGGNPQDGIAELAHLAQRGQAALFKFGIGECA